MVGPNGSGKSNVIDAMLFVFGYRAKKIRQAKLKDLIHKSENHRDLDYCRVTVFFQEIIDRVRRHREERGGEQSSCSFSLGVKSVLLGYNPVVLSCPPPPPNTQEDGEFDVIPGSEMEVMREATSQNQSTYYLDGKKTNFKELGVLLRNKGIDLDHNRFLILQGEVESIAMMKPKAQNENDDGLLEYLEDIIG